MQIGHELGGEIVRPETVENDDEGSTSRLVACVAGPIVAPARAEYGTPENQRKNA
jgi:hypothetical protein